MKIKTFILIIILVLIGSACTRTQTHKDRANKEYILHIKNDSLSTVYHVYCDSFVMTSKYTIIFYSNGTQNTIVSDIIVPKTNITKYE